MRTRAVIDRICRARAWGVWLAVLAVAVLLNAVIPPIQSPDENSHLARAYLLSRGHILLDRNPAGSGGAIDEGLLRYTDMFHDVGTGQKLDAGLVNGVAPYIRWTGVELRRVYAGTGYYFPIIYLPQAVALWIGRHLDLTIGETYELARLTVVLVAAGIIMLSLTLVRPSFAVLALLAMPMVIFQVVSTTIDGMSLGLCMLAISCFLSLMRQGATEEGGWRFVMLCATVLILAGSRAHALPMLLMPFVVAWQRRRKSYFAAATLILVLTLGWTLFALLTVKDLRIPREVTTGQVLRYYAVRPGELFKLLADTLSQKLAYYRDTFVGTLGYLDIYLPGWYQRSAVTALLLLMLLSIKMRATFVNEGLARAVLVLAALGSCLVVFVALLATWTPFPSTIIDGVQGRYFHIPFMMLAYALSGVTEQPRWQTALSAIIFAVFVLMGISVTSTALLNSYWLQDRRYTALETAPPQGREPLVLDAGSALTARYHSPAGGRLYSAGFNLGTYFGGSKGILALKICSTGGCASGSTDVSRAIDNQYAYIGLDKPLPVEAGETLTVSLTLTESHSRVALWSHKKGDEALPVEVNGKPAELTPYFRVGIQ